MSLCLDPISFFGFGYYKRFRVPINFSVLSSLRQLVDHRFRHKITCYVVKRGDSDGERDLDTELLVYRKESDSDDEREKRGIMKLQEKRGGCRVARVKGRV